MASRVDGQSIVSLKAFPAEVTGVRLLTCVAPHVGFHVKLTAETFPAGLTSKRLLARVGPYVSPQVEVTAEAPPTPVAGVCFFARAVAQCRLRAAVSVAVTLRYELLFLLTDLFFLFVCDRFGLCFLLTEFLSFLFTLRRLSFFFMLLLEV